MIRNYSQLTIKQFIQCKIISELEPDPLMRNIRMVAEVMGKTDDEIESLPIEKLKLLIKDYSDIEQLQADKKIRLKFKVKGRRFEVVWKTQEMTASQFIDATHFIKDREAIVKNIHNILAAVCVKCTWYGKRLKYNGDNHKETADLFYNHMKIAQAYPIMLFFCRYSEELERNITTCLMKELEKTKVVLEKHLQPGGVGSLQSIT